MVFNSVDFLVFFPCVLAVWYLLPRGGRWAWLLAASLAAYGFYQPLLLVHLLLVTAVTYFLAFTLAGVEDRGRRKRVVAAGIALLCANLFAFKYTSFVNESLRGVFGWFGAGYPVPVLELLLPIGISFYTFQLISYLVDVFRGAKPERHFGLFALYVLFFPKMVAGPIERANHLLPQLRETRPFDPAAVAAGLQLMVWGAFKKVVVADRLAPFVARVYESPTEFDGVVTIFATVLFAFQIYCDFSGYTDMALGAAQTFGYRLTNNFNRPYLATSIQDFWKRWHITLTSWLTDYVYTPLTRNRVIKIKWYYLMLISLFVTFLISGLWHGAQWTFVLWGALHGGYLVTSAVTQKWRNRVAVSIGLTRRPRLLRAWRVAATFTLVCFAYILFNASSIGDAVFMMSNLWTGWGHPVASIRGFLWETTPEFLLGAFGIFVVVCVDALDAGADIRSFMAPRSRPVRWGFYYATLVSIVVLGAFYDTSHQFIYFQF